MFVAMTPSACAERSPVSVSTARAIARRTSGGRFVDVSVINASILSRNSSIVLILVIDTAGGARCTHSARKCTTKARHTVLSMAMLGDPRWAVAPVETRHGLSCTVLIRRSEKFLCPARHPRVHDAVYHAPIVRA